MAGKMNVSGASNKSRRLTDWSGASYGRKLRYVRTVRVSWAIRACRLGTAPDLGGAAARIVGVVVSLFGCFIARCGWRGAVPGSVDGIDLTEQGVPFLEAADVG
jgi:hypothetical protein